MKNLYNALQLKQLYQLKNMGYYYTSAKPFSGEEQNPLELPNNLVELQEQADNCHLCVLSKSRNRVVFGEGNPHADIMFIGDVPITLEDKEGRPFLGRGGEMLTLMIEKVLGLLREEVYVTNFIKCHTLHGQVPKEVEIQTCRAYVMKEIELVNPKIVVTLGELPYEYLYGDKQALKNIRGSVLSCETYTLIPTYHPNFLLKNPSLKREVFRDLKKIKSLLL
jgi:DNA polymerase